MTGQTELNPAQAEGHVSAKARRYLSGLVEIGQQVRGRRRPPRQVESVHSRCQLHQAHVC